MSTIDPAAIDAALAQITADAEASAYHINPDTPFTRDLIEGLLVNEARYGYRACPEGVRASPTTFNEHRAGRQRIADRLRDADR